MIEQNSLKHHIQRSIVSYLMLHEYARFRDLRPERVDTNLFSYHLKLLLKSGYVVKDHRGYTLGSKGLRYVDRVRSDTMHLRTQPKIITMLLVQDGYGKVLLQKRTKQPSINTWTLPYGKLHIDDTSVLAAARREANEKLQYDPHKLRHVGDCYIRVMHDEVIESTTLVHVVRFETDGIAATDTLQWVEPLALARLKLAPAVEQIVTRSFFGDEFFFEEFEVAS
jgi:8-oxo-dGTP pyrophosphatase MutT (NUDIX family)